MENYTKQDKLIPLDTKHAPHKWRKTFCMCTAAGSAMEWDMKWWWLAAVLFAIWHKLNGTIQITTV